MAARKNDRSGVALIIVLGLVAVLLIVCVTFTINMRVERAGAANLRHATVARQIVKGAMSAAIAAIDWEVFTDITPQWYDTNDIDALTYEVSYTDWNSKKATLTMWRNSCVSYDPKATTNVAANFFTPEVEAYFPSGSAFKGYATKHGGTAVDLPRWLPVYAGANRTDVIGRYAFFALDTSGLLDLNGVHREERWMGRLPSEIQLSDTLFAHELNPANMPQEGFLKALKKGLAAHGTYDSFAEFRALNEDVATPLFEATRSFNIFSYDPGPTNPLVYVGGDVQSLTEQMVDCPKAGRTVANKWAIIDAFYASGLTASSDSFVRPSGCPAKLDVSEQACWAYLGLVDYVDDDDEMFVDADIDIMPWERPVTENLPVMSGFIAKFTATAHELVIEDGFIKDNEALGKAYKVDPDKCAMTLAVDFKIPFVYSFMKTRPDSSDKMRIEGRAALLVAKLPTAANSQNKPFRKLVDKLNEAEDRCSLPRTSGPNDPLCDFSFPDDIAMHIPTNNFCVTAEDISKVNGAPPSLQGMRLYFKAAGETRLANRGNRPNEPEHRYPLASNHFGDFNAWMACSYEDFSGNHDFLSDVFATKEYKTPDGPARDKNGNKITYKVWTPEPVVTWAEFHDPRFASKDMKEMVVDGAGEPDINHFIYYRPSHRDADQKKQEKYHFDVPAAELKTNSKTSDVFGSFTAADNVSAADFDGPASDPDIHGGYFNGGAARNGGTSPRMGASPVASYVLTHPAVAGGLYGMRMDGVRYRRDNSQSFDAEDHVDTAQRQWRAYVKNGPLESVGELGYLPIGMWYTIRLYDYGDGEYDDKGNYKQEGQIKFPKRGSNWSEKMTRFNHLPCDDRVSSRPYHPVLDFFTVVPEKERPQGRINLNSLNASVLASAFHLMPIGTEEDSHLDPGDRTNYDKYRIDAEPEFETDSLDVLAEAILAHREGDSAHGRPPASFEHLSDLGKIFRYGPGSTPPPNGYPLNGKGVGHAVDAVATAAKATGSREKTAQRKKYGEFERESVIRNSCGLFTTRGQTFIIAVRGESYSPMFGKTSLADGSINAGKTAIGQIWRDTFPSNYDEVEKEVAKIKDPEEKDEYRRKNYVYPKFVQFFKIIDD